MLCVAFRHKFFDNFEEAAKLYKAPDDAYNHER